MERHESAARHPERFFRRARRWPFLFAAASLLVSALLLASTALFIARPGLAGAVLGPQQGQADPPQAQFAQPPAWALAPAQPKPGCRYFPETQHNLCAGFRAYWETYGGLLEFGFPLTEEFVDPVLGRTVQWFERARFEWHPGVIPARFDVLEGRVGAELLALGGAPPAPTPTPTLTIDLTPASDTNAVGTLHTVTATVLRNGSPAAGERVRFRVTGGGNPSPTSGSDVTNNAGQARFSFSNTLAATNTIEAWVDLDNDGTRDADEPMDTATKTWTGELSIDLTPASATNPVGTNHTVTAVVERNGTPVSGQRVRFRVTGGGNPSPTSGSDVTDNAGEATFTFTNTLAATNTIEAWIDFDNDGVRDADEPRDTATKEWVVSTPSALDAEPESATVVIGTQHTITATVTDQFGNPVANVRVRARVTGVNPQTLDCGTTGSNGTRTCQYTGDTPGVDQVEVWADLNNNSSREAGEPNDIVSVTWTVTGTLTLTPTSTGAGNVGDTTTDTTATVTVSGTTAGVPVVLVITDGTANGSFAACPADEDEIADTTSGGATNTFSTPIYACSGSAGTSFTVRAYHDVDNNGVRDPGEPQIGPTRTFSITS